MGRGLEGRDLVLTEVFFLHFLDEAEENNENFNCGSRCPGRDSN
jgi:hypothetical protein